MTPKQREEGDKRREAAQARMAALFKEDKSFKRSGTDPEFTVEDIVAISGFAPSTVRQMLVDANVGCVALRPGPYGGRMVKTRVVRWSQLKKLAQEFGWV